MQRNTSHDFVVGVPEKEYTQWNKVIFNAYVTWQYNTLGDLSDYVIFSNLIMKLHTPQKIINKLLTRFFLLLIWVSFVFHIRLSPISFFLLHLTPQFLTAR
jgi:hypothetical protein